MEVEQIRVIIFCFILLEQGEQYWLNTHFYICVVSAASLCFGSIIADTAIPVVLLFEVVEVNGIDATKA